MATEIFSLAILDARPGKEDELMNALRELYQLMNDKGYCRDTLYRDSSSTDRFIHFRHWTSAEMRAEAQIDPEVHRYWQMLPELCDIKTIYETLEKLFETSG